MIRQKKLHRAIALALLLAPAVAAAQDEPLSVYGDEAAGESNQGLFQQAPAVMLLAEAEEAEEAESDDADSGEETEGEEARDLGKLSVTGTRLDNAPAGSTVYTIDRAEMDARGMSSVEDVIRYLPQNFSTITKGGTFDGQSPRYSAGQVTANLRGLGEGATLVLVNGRRIAASPAESGTYTDISTIPYGAIERVEVMPDGGSAIYGSDAVAGVINFILKKNYRGSETRLRYEDSSAGGDAWIFEQSLGVTWTTGNITASLNYMEEDPVLPANAGVPTEADFRDQGGRAFVSTYGAPGIIPYWRGIPGAPPGTCYGLFPDGPGTNVTINDLHYVSCSDVSNQEGDFELFSKQNPFGYGWMTPQTEQSSVYLSLDQDIGSSLSLNVSGMWSERDSLTSRWSNAIAEWIPESNYYNNLGQDVYLQYTFTNEIASGQMDALENTSISERWNVFTSLEWRMPWGDWKSVLAYDFGEDGHQTEALGGIGGYYGTDAYKAALASSDPNTALNYFGDGSAQHPDLRSLMNPVNDRGTRYGLYDELSLAFDGTLAELPGGRLEMAVGVQARTDELDFGSYDLNPFTFYEEGAPRIIPKADNTAYFVEFALPLFSEQNARPGLQRLAFQLAARHDEYEIRGPFEGALEPFSSRSWDDWTPKVGVSWYPVEDLQIRATWGEQFMAPTLVELFNPVLCFNTPCDSYDWYGTYDPLSPDGPAYVYPTTILGGNPDLHPMWSDTTTIGFDWNPHFLPGLTVTATYNRIEFTDIISNLRSALGWTPLPALENPEQFPGLVERDADGYLTFISYQSANLASQETESIDVFVQYAWDSSVGSWRVGTTGTKTTKLDFVAAPGSDVISTEGTLGHPSRWRANFFADWNLGRWTANATVQYQEGVDNTDPWALVTKVDSVTTVDAQASYDIMESGWYFTGGVRNLFDEDFPFVDSRAGIDTTRMDLRRRIWFLEVTKEFQW